MIDLKILRQQVELGATPQQIVDMVEKMLAEEAAARTATDEFSVITRPRHFPEIGSKIR